MGFKPIQKRMRVYEEVIQQIEYAIEQGEIQPGEKLPSERQLAEMMGVSRTSIKEAVSVLESSGVIIVRPGVGMFLNANSQLELLESISTIFAKKEYDFMNLIELRQAVEGDAAYYAAKRITTKQKEELTAAFHTLLHAEKNGLDGIYEDYQFHYMIVEATNNPVMLNVMNLVADRMINNLRESRKSSLQSEHLNEEVMKEHKKIYDAIIQNHPELAKKAMWEHHQAIKRRYLEMGSDGKRG